MNLIIASEADTASVNLRDRLLEMAEWKEDGGFSGEKIWRLTRNYGAFCSSGTRLITLRILHILAEGIDQQWFVETESDIDNIVNWPQTNGLQTILKPTR